MKIKKLIATIGKSKYYIHGAFTRKEYRKIIFWNCYYFTDLILKGQTYFLFKNLVTIYLFILNPVFVLNTSIFYFLNLFNNITLHSINLIFNIF